MSTSGDATLVELQAERMVAGGDALAREPGGRVVFVDGALPGEVVQVRLVEEKADHARAVVVRVERPSPERVEAPCSFVAEGCGGCSWQHIAPSAQVEFKRAIVAEALARTGGLPDAEVRVGPTLATTSFRTTLRLAVDGAGRTGLRGRRSHDVVAVDPCLVAHPRLVELLGVRFPGAREVTLRCGVPSGERSAVTDPPEAVEMADLPAEVSTGARAAIRTEIAGVELRVSAGSFFQTRTDGAEVLVALVAEAVGPEPVTRLVDAYGGVGLFSATLRHADVGEVVVVERNRSSCNDARRNLRGRAARVVVTDVERWSPERAEVVVADPSRRGLGATASAVLAATGASRLVLVSCDAVSLARDAALLAGHGFAHAGSTVVDLFPHTPHLEVVTRFTRG